MDSNLLCFDEMWLFNGQKDKGVGKIADLRGVWMGIKVILGIELVVEVVEFSCYEWYDDNR